MLGEDVAVDAAAQHETAKSVLGLPGVHAAHLSVDNKVHKEDHERYLHLRLVEDRHAPT